MVMLIDNNHIDIFILSASINLADIQAAQQHKNCSGYIVKPLTKNIFAQLENNTHTATNPARARTIEH